ncbi:MAG: hypothetical protein WBC73_05575 [Phormidesmis sp.]
MKVRSQLLWLFSLGVVLAIALYSLVPHLPNSQPVRPPAEMGAPLLENLGDHNHPVTTQEPLAQRYFNQGLVLAYGFNHAEAVRSFQAATVADPDCAMCHWGLAYALGPNINAAMETGDVPTAFDAIQTAQALSTTENLTEVEQAYIHAMAQRYSAEPVDDRSPLDRAFAQAAGKVAKAYPEDLDAQTLYAEALMDTMPWDYWLENGEPRPETTEVLNTLETVIDKNPNHAWALHLYIHAVEKQRPELGIAAADRLGDLVPAAGHLVHMPSHIYIRVGRYHDAVVANQKAVLADQDYITQCHAQGLYQLGYMPHNHHFLWFAALMDGEQKVATEAALHTAQIDHSMMRKPGYGTLQHYFSIPLYTQVKFEQWDEILSTSAPEADLVYPTGVWHYARGMAYAANGKVTEAEKSLVALRAIEASPDLEGVTIWDINTTADLLEIASEALSGEILAVKGDYEGAIAHLKTGVTLEDALNYDEPASWYSPVRQMLGNVLLQANRPAEAEKIYREDLAIYPENGWSLKGLAKSLEAQDETAAAREAQRRLNIAWKQADFSVVR